MFFKNKLSPNEAELLSILENNNEISKFFKPSPSHNFHFGSTSLLLYTHGNIAFSRCSIENCSFSILPLFEIVVTLSAKSQTLLHLSSFISPSHV